MNSCKEIANSYSLWEEFVDTLGLDSEEAFDEKSEQEKIEFIIACFGDEEEQELE